MSTSIGKIAIATDFSMYSHRAALRAGALAKEHGAALRLLHVLDRASVRALQRFSPADSSEDEALVGEARKRLEALAGDVVAASGVAGECIVEIGEVNDAVLAMAASSDLLVLGARGLNPAKDLLLGATAERIARRVECPLLVAKQDSRIEYQSALVPVDFSDHSLRALRYARVLAPGAVLHVLHVYDPPFVGRLSSAGVSDEAMVSYRHSARLEIEAQLREFLSRAPDVKDVNVRIELGDARTAIAAQAEGLMSSLIVMGKQGRSWWSEFLLGSLARRTIELAPCDVVIVPVPLSGYFR
jgi:nucleotide-binding universal stress UspA family protein